MAWNDRFIERETQLNDLKTLWGLAKTGQPQIGLLLGHTGIGKTRIAQEFYAWLSQNEDPENYWPDGFSGDNRDRVNPVFDPDKTESDSSSGAQAKKTPKNIPWLWWGFRFQRPSQDHRIDEDVALRRTMPRLLPHLEPIIAKRKLKEANANMFFKFLGLMGNAVNLVGIPATLRDLFTLRKDQKERRELVEKARMGPAETDRADLESLQQLAVEFCAALLDDRDKTAPTIPIILFVDDAQWIDEVTLKFLVLLYQRAWEKKWPLLILATHWEEEWPNPDPAGPRNEITKFRHFVESYIAVHPNALGRMPVDKLIDLGQLLRSEFPNLPESQSNLILERVDGNPGLLEEVIKLLKERARWFQNGALTDKGLEGLQNAMTSREGLVRTRFEAMGEEIQNVLGWSSLQGRKFFREITERISAIFPNHPPEVTDTGNFLTQAEKNHGLVRSLSPGGFNRGEFRQTLFLETARRFLGDRPEEEALARTALKQTLSSWLLEGKLSEEGPRRIRGDAGEPCGFGVVLLFLGSSRDPTGGSRGGGAAAGCGDWLCGSDRELGDQDRQSRIAARITARRTGDVNSWTVEEIRGAWKNLRICILNYVPVRHCLVIPNSSPSKTPHAPSVVSVLFLLKRPISKSPAIRNRGLTSPLLIFYLEIVVVVSGAAKTVGKVRKCIIRLYVISNYRKWNFVRGLLKG